MVWVAVEMSLGTMLSYSISDLLPSESCSSDYINSWFVLWLRGMVFVDVTVILLLSNTIGPVLSRALGGADLAQWSEGVKAHLNALVLHWRTKNWDGIQNALNLLRNELVFKTFFRYNILPKRMK